MKKIETFDIFILLLLPALALAKTIPPFFKVLGYTLNVPSHTYFSQGHIVFMVAVVGALGVFTYTSALNVLSTLTKMSARMAKLLAYTLSLVLMIVGINIALGYVLSETVATANSYTWVWPATFNSSEAPVLMLVRDFLIDILFAGIISWIAAVGINKTLIRLQKKFRNQ